MRTNWVLTTAVLAMSVTSSVGAQSAGAVHPPSKGDTVSMTYTGCVASVNHGASFLLTRIDGGHAGFMDGDRTAKHHDEAPMKSDGATTMKHEQTAMAGEKTEAMLTQSFTLAGATDLSKHVGQKVSETGTRSDGSAGMREDVSTLTIKTLKVIAKSCS